MSLDSKLRRRRGVVVALLASALLAAACGSSGHSGASAATTVAGAKTTAAAGPMGAPIKVMTEAGIDTNLTAFPNVRDTSKFFAQWVNDHGGIKDGNGTKHRLEVTFCDDKQDPNESA